MLISQQETKAKPAPQTLTEEYPEIEQFIPYDPLGILLFCVITCLNFSVLISGPHPEDQT